MDEKCNFERISLCPDSYADLRDPTDTKEDRVQKLCYDLTDIVRILLKNGYQMRIKSDGYSIMVDFNHDDPGLAGADLVWLGDERLADLWALEERKTAITDRPKED